MAMYEQREEEEPRRDGRRRCDFRLRNHSDYAFSKQVHSHFSLVFSASLCKFSIIFSTVCFNVRAYTCRGKNVEKPSVGVLQKLLPHLPELNNLYTRGSISNSNSNAANYKLQPPSNLKSPAWFTLSTFSRYLDIVGSTDLLDTAKVIEAEMSQLEEAKRFHLSVCAQGHQDHNQSSENGKSQQFGVQSSSLETSKNELLRDMGSRFTSLRSKLV
ncbi:uncharacterized protein LOC120151325 [Hibiscus syriacus]|uniref:uncharacterized protein LOC120151325 n=1 Tax=Hibiscus syriacus TaxID=106335 RepID=UPI00192248BC|nr:uncharacterized protein LOC120151325 [Hibiscus syriacus]